MPHSSPSPSSLSSSLSFSLSSPLSLAPPNISFTFPLSFSLLFSLFFLSALTKVGISSKDLVIARCQEDILWAVTASSSFDRTFIYRKCDVSIPLEIENVRRQSQSHYRDQRSGGFTNITTFIQSRQTRQRRTDANFHTFITSSIFLQTLPNIGGCDNTYLTHIVRHWDDLADWTVFYKGTFSALCPPQNLSAPEESIHRDAWTLCCDGPWSEEVVGSSGFNPFFTMKAYVPTHNQGNATFHPYNGNLGVWMKHTFGREQSLKMFQSGVFSCFGGYFAVHRDTIKKHPKSTYEAVLVHQIDPNAEVRYSLSHFCIFNNHILPYFSISLFPPFSPFLSPYTRQTHIVPLPLPLSLSKGGPLHRKAVVSSLSLRSRLRSQAKSHETRIGSGRGEGGEGGGEEIEGGGGGGGPLAGVEASLRIQYPSKGKVFFLGILFRFGPPLGDGVPTSVLPGRPLANPSHILAIFLKVHF